MNRTTAALALALWVAPGLSLAAGAAETVEVAPGVAVTKKHFDGPDSDAPFNNFTEKSPLLRQADDIFIALALQTFGSRAKVFEHLAGRGWAALDAADFAQSITRFNQAFLFAPEQSQVFHGFAIIAYTHYEDTKFADELFKVALQQPGRLARLNADYGHFLLAANRSGDAEPVLEQAVKDTPDAGDAFADLALARLRNQDPAGACLAVDQADKLSLADHARASLRWIGREAQCAGR